MKEHLNITSFMKLIYEIQINFGTKFGSLWEFHLLMENNILKSQTTQCVFLIISHLKLLLK